MGYDVVPFTLGTLKMKDIIELIKFGVGTPIYVAGVIAWTMLGLSFYPPLSFVPKAFLLYVLTH